MDAQFVRERIKHAVFALQHGFHGGRQLSAHARGKPFLDARQFRRNQRADNARRKQRKLLWLLGDIDERLI